MAQRTRHMAGFTLVEMIVVVVVVGFIVGAVMGGRALIRSAELQKVASEFQDYEGRIIRFQDKYRELPGDFTRAGSFWTAATSGDGDGRVGGYQEEVEAWHHLSLSGLVSASYIGVTPPLVADAYTPGTHVPASALDTNVYVFEWHAVHNRVENALHLYEVTFSGGTDRLSAGSLTPEEARTLDIKIDDGVASQGNMVAHDGRSPFFPSGLEDCVDTVTLDYDVSKTDSVCRMIYWLGDLNRFN